jgi:hypothetical protein
MLINQIESRLHAIEYAQRQPGAKPVADGFFALAAIINNDPQGTDLSTAWRVVATHFDDASEFEAHRCKIETAWCEYFGAETEIPMTCLGYTYSDHPIAAFQKLRGKPFLSHVTDQEVCAAIKKQHYWKYGEARHRYPPRVDPHEVQRCLREQYGSLCVACKRAEFEPALVSLLDDDDQLTPVNRKVGQGHLLPDQQFYICEDCIIAGHRRRQLAFARDQIVNRRKAQERARKRAERVARYATARAERDARLEQERVEREAAYQLVKELGLFDLIKERTETNEATTVDRHVAQHAARQPTRL